jgi:hypothetical protein
MAVGIHKGILDEDVCHAFWADVLKRDYLAAKVFIEHIRVAEHEATPHTYANLETLTNNWEEKAGRLRGKSRPQSN